MPANENTQVLKVAKVVNEFTVVINQGGENGIAAGQRFLIYSVGEEIFDPDTKQTLGQLEIVKGTGKVTHVQPRMATISSDMKSPPGRTIRKMGGQNLAGWRALALLGAEEVEEVLPPEPTPFSSPEVGDLAKRI